MAIPPLSGQQRISSSTASLPLQSLPHSTPDVLILQSTSLTDSIKNVWDSVVLFFTNLWKSISSCLWQKSIPLQTELSNTNPLLLHGSSLASPQHISNSNKLFVYNNLAQGRPVGDGITVTKFSLKNPQCMEDRPLFLPFRPQVTEVNGTFLYTPSTSDTVYWTANFADSHLFGFCEGPLLAQDELQVLEHPALAHIKNALPADLRRLQPYDAALFQDVPRLGDLNTVTPLADGQTLYGNRFAAASQAEILSRLTRFAAPVNSNIFAIAAPHISAGLHNQPYHRQDLGTLFFTAYNAFQGIKQRCPGKRVVIDTGNWGAGAFGNDPKTTHLIQMAAARLAGVDEIRMYPKSASPAFQAAKQLLQQIETQSPNMTIGNFLDNLTTNAATYGLRYGLGNGT